MTPAPELVEAVSAAVAKRDARREGSEVRFRCPEAAQHRNGDAHPSARWNPRKAVWFCDVCGAHGGVTDLARRLGVERSTFGTHKKNSAERTTTYAIRDVSGKVVAEHVRLDLPDGEKRMWWRRNGQDGLGGLKSRDLPLYGAPDLAAAPPDATVILVEGEKPRDALAARGILAVGTVTGAAGCPADAVLQQLVGHDVVLWPDNDGDGRTHMARIAARLKVLGT